MTNPAIPDTPARSLKRGRVSKVENGQDAQETNAEIPLTLGALQAFTFHRVLSESELLSSLLISDMKTGGGAHAHSRHQIRLYLDPGHAARRASHCAPRADGFAHRKGGSTGNYWSGIFERIPGEQARRLDSPALPCSLFQFSLGPALDIRTETRTSIKANHVVLLCPLLPLPRIQSARCGPQGYLARYGDARQKVLCSRTLHAEGDARNVRKGRSAVHGLVPSLED
jgi:hypothetical protein